MAARKKRKPGPKPRSKPDPSQAQLNVRVPRELVEELRAGASADDRTMAAHVVRVIQAGLASNGTEAALSAQIVELTERLAAIEENLSPSI